MKKGFTLIELLAVIVILAIIALIATPIILGIINDMKKKSIEISVDNYLSAVEQAIVRKNLKGEFKPTVCIVTSLGLECEGYNEPLKVDVDGECPTIGTMYFSNGKVANGTILNFDGYIKKINNLSKENVKPVTETTKTTGFVPVIESGNIKPGSEFKIKVNSNSDWLTFFVLSNDGEYVNLIAEQNITPNGKFDKEPQYGDEWYITSSNSYDNKRGPQTAYTYLSKATSNWTNIPIIENFSYQDERYEEGSSGYRSIITELDSYTGKYKTTITQLLGDIKTYENLRVRLPYISEIKENTTCGKSINQPPNNYGDCPIWMVNYLSSDSHTEKYYNSSNGKVNSDGKNQGYWLLATAPGAEGILAYHVDFNGYLPTCETSNSRVGIRPVIKILKSDLLRVME